MNWIRERLAFRLVLEAAWCFVVTAVVLIGSFVVIGYFIDWMLGRAE